MTEEELDKKTLKWFTIIGVCLIVLVLAGCAPYAELGAGYRFDSHMNTEWDEDCSIGYAAAGLERGPWSIAYQHTSCLTERPEIITDHVIVKRKFGGEK